HGDHAQPAQKRTQHGTTPSGNDGVCPDTRRACHDCPLVQASGARSLAARAARGSEMICKRRAIFERKDGLSQTIEWQALTRGQGMWRQARTIKMSCVDPRVRSAVLSWAAGQSDLFTFREPRNVNKIRRAIGYLFFFGIPTWMVVIFFSA